MGLMLHMLVFYILCILFRNELTHSASQNEANNRVFNLDHTAIEKNIAAIFNKVAHSSATTKRSISAYDAQVPRSATHSNSPSSAITSYTTSLMLHPMILQKANTPLYRESPSYVPSSRALFNPPLPAEYANPFVNKPMLRGSNFEVFAGVRRPVPPPNFTPAHERIPIKPPNLLKNTIKSADTHVILKDEVIDSVSKGSFEKSDKDKHLNNTIEFVPSLHFTSISRILSGSNGRKQDIPEILLKPILTKSPQNYFTMKSEYEVSSTTMPILKASNNVFQTTTYSSIIPSLNRKTDTKDSIAHNYSENSKTINEPYKIRNVDIVHSEELPFPQPQPPAMTSEEPYVNANDEYIITRSNEHPLETTWKIVWSLHVYLAATMFTLIALYSIYKIVRFDDATNLLTQSYFLTIHLLLTVVCTLRCFHLFYDAYNLGHSLPEIISKVLMFLPSSLLAAAFATLILYMSRCSAVPSLYRNKFSSPVILVFAFIIHITLCISLDVISYILGYIDDLKILPLIVQCIYIIICITLGLSYMYVYRVIRSQLHIIRTKYLNNHITTDYTTLNTAITTTIGTALLFILMGFVQLYGIFGVKRHLQPYPWLWWGWEFSVRLIELSTCSLLVWVASLSHYKLKQKEIQQQVVNSRFAPYPYGNSSSNENMDDVLYPAICTANQAIQNYAIRTGRQVYDDSFPLNTLPGNLNVTSTFERHSTRTSGTLGNFQPEIRNSFGQARSDTESLRNSNSRNRHYYALPSSVHEHPRASGSAMLVAEDDFIRFRNLDQYEDDLSDIQSVIESSDESRNSLTSSDNCHIKPSTIATQRTQNIHENSVSHFHLSDRSNEDIIYNNT